MTFFASSLSTLLSFPITILIGRYLGAGDLGLYRMTNTLLGIIVMFVALGIPAAVTRYIAYYREEEDKKHLIYSAAIILSLISGGMLATLMYINASSIAGIFGMEPLSPLMRIVAFAIPFSLLNGVILGYLNGLRQMKRVAVITIIQSSVMLLVTTTLTLFYGIEGAVIGLAVTPVLIFLLLFFMQKDHSITVKAFSDNARTLISFGSRTFLSNAINLVNYKADILMIGFFLAETDVGVYSIAVMFGQFLWIFPQSIQKITYPLLTEYHSRDQHEQMIGIIDISMKYSCLFLLISSTALFILGPWFTKLIFGPQFLDCIPALNVLLIGIVIYGVTKSIGAIFASIGKVELVYRIPLYSAGLNIILNALLIPEYGILGGAIATSISLITSTALMLYYLKKILDIRPDIDWFSRVMAFTGLVFFVYILMIGLIDPLYPGVGLLLVEIVVFVKYFSNYEHIKLLIKTLKLNKKGSS